MAIGPGKAYRQGITLIEAVQKYGYEEAVEEVMRRARRARPP